MCSIICDVCINEVRRNVVKSRNDDLHGLGFYRSAVVHDQRRREELTKDLGVVVSEDWGQHEGGREADDRDGEVLRGDGDHFAATRGDHSSVGENGEGRHDHLVHARHDGIHA